MTGATLGVGRWQSYRKTGISQERCKHGAQKTNAVLKGPYAPRQEVAPEPSPTEKWAEEMKE
jgi:hypothetical protein